MLQHSFVLDALGTTGADTFSHFEMLLEEHRRMDTEKENQETSSCTATTTSTRSVPSRLARLVPTIGKFHTHLPLRKAFEVYNAKHCLTARKHIQISFNEIRHIMNLAQIMAFCPENESEAREQNKDLLPSIKDATITPDPSNTQNNDVTGQFRGPKFISFDGDQTLYSDGANFESNLELAYYLYLLLKNGVTVAVVTAAGYEYKTEKYEYRLSGLLRYFQQMGLTEQECERFYLFGGECNYLIQLKSDFKLHPVREDGPGGWCTSTKHMPDAPANWKENQVQELLNVAEECVHKTVKEMNLRGRVIRKKRSVGLVPTARGNHNSSSDMTRESLDETVLRIHEVLGKMNEGQGPGLPYCAFNGGSDCWIDCGNKRVGVQILQSYTGIVAEQTLHIGDQFLNTGNDYAARAVSPCIWIINPQETTYILKSILRLAGVSVTLPTKDIEASLVTIDAKELHHEDGKPLSGSEKRGSSVDFNEMERRACAVQTMDVYTGDTSTTK